ncbi:hypothetical protein HPB49_022576 [Dermacentor silvarum]|uniref:Uncharacterized protein n=1 Tax=Dermacentor silvarum TaxID=543639 RepID=A0ACB8DR59_DERSI|nr:hypothetical protein HPB49_022576 [Dermacentor silvarum]
MHPLEPWLMTHVPGHSALNAPKGRFKSAHASTRSAVESCMGVPKERFRCLQRQRALHYGPRKAGTIVAACAALHNLCLDEDQLAPGDGYSLGEGEQDDSALFGLVDGPDADMAFMVVKN